MAKQELKQPAIDTATIQNKISEPLRKAIEPLLERPATVFDAQIRELELLLGKVDEMPKSSVQPLKDSLRSLVEARESANRDYLDAVRKNIANAVVGALRQVDSAIPLAIRQREAAVEPRQNGSIAEASSNGRKPRMSRSEVDELAARVLKVMPTAKSDNWISRAEIVEKAGVDNESLQSVLLKLKREAKAVSNGQRGSAGGWRKAE